MAGVDSNIDKIIRAWERRARVIRPIMQAATTDATREVYAESKRQMTKLIYDKPVPTKAEVAAERGQLSSKTGRIGVMFAAKNKSVGFVTSKTYAKKKAWTRTGNLRREEKMRVASAYLGIISNNATSKTKSGKRSPYARARHDMKNTRFPAPWRANAVTGKQETVRLIYREAFRRAIRAGVIPGI